MNLEEMSFYRWKEKPYDFDDIIFIVNIDFNSSPGTIQCYSFQMESINSDMEKGKMYNYHYYKDKDGYDIQKLSIDDVDKKFFFESVFYRRINF